MPLKGEVISAAVAVLYGIEICYFVRVSDPSALRASGREEE